MYQSNINVSIKERIYRFAGIKLEVMLALPQVFLKRRQFLQHKIFLRIYTQKHTHTTLLRTPDGDKAVDGEVAAALHQAAYEEAALGEPDSMEASAEPD